MSLGIDSEPTGRRMMVFDSKPDTRVISTIPPPSSDEKLKALTASLKAIMF